MELAPSPKVQVHLTVPKQLEGVAEEANATWSGGAPEVGEASAVQVRVHGTLTVTVPVFVQVTPWTDAVIIQL
jgi:hypothetical protein